MRSWPRSGISRPSCWSKAVSACSTSALAGAGSVFISPNIAGAKVTGVTLSEEQLKLARGRAAERHLTDLVEFRLQDYRDLNERFDRIVSVGMFEHVGVDHFRGFFDQCGAAAERRRRRWCCIRSGGSEGPNATNPWIDKYIFPGGYIPALSEVLPAIERAGLLVTDIEILRLHYAETLKALADPLHGPSERKRAGFMTSDSCGCGNFTWPHPRWRSAIRA